ncbi:MAG: hypothetical protein QW057_07885 [Candidatus Bathyarchaeia archaeon]
MILAALLLVLSGNVLGFAAAAQEIGAGKVFYAWAPRTIREASKLDVVGLTDGTKVSVYDITGEPAKLMKEGTINRMGLLTVETEKETYYKVVSDKPVAVSVGAGNVVLERGPGGSMFYPAVDGSYVGKDFIFMAQSGGNTTYPYIGLTIYAVEDAAVTVKDSAGNEITSVVLTANSFYDVSGLVRRRQMVQVQSTGRIMIASWWGGRFTSLPSVTGDFIGRKFFGYINYYQIVWEVQPGGRTSWSNQGGQGMFIVYAYEPSDVKVYDLASGQLLYNKTLGNVGDYWYVYGPTAPPPTSGNDPPSTPYDPNLAPKHLRFESTGNIAVWSGDGGDSPAKIAQPAHWGETADITFTAGIDAKDFWFYAPQKAVIFAPTDVNVNVNGSAKSLKKDTYLTLTSGYYHVTSNNPIIVQVMAGASTDYYGTYLVSYADIPATAPETGGGFPLWIAGVAAVAVIAVVVVVFMQRGKRKAA